MATMTRAERRAAGTPSVACADDPERMFPVDQSDRPGQRTRGERRAIAVCERCPMLVTCRRAVLGLDGSAPLGDGVAGGMTREDRRAVRAASRRLSDSCSWVPVRGGAASSGLTSSRGAGREAA